MANAKFCKRCKELVYSEFCLNCSGEATSLNSDDDQTYDDSIDVDDGTSKWGDGEQGMTVLNFDEVFGSETE